MTSRLTSAARGIGSAILDTYRLGGRMFVAAPLMLAIAMVPEFVQHVAEIKLGMFASADAFRSLANDPTRWSFGYAKVTGFVLAILFTARFRAVGSVRTAFLIPPRDLLRLVLAIALTFVAALPFEWLGKQALPPALDWTAQAVSALVQSGLTVFVAAALFGDREMTLAGAFGRYLPTALMIALLAAVAFVPSQALHMANHKLALGQPAALVWALMIWDTLVVGLLAGLVGSALWVGYRSGATWRGWAPRAPK